MEYDGDLSSGQMYSIMWIGIGLLIGGVLIAAVSVGLFIWLRPKRVTDEASGKPAGDIEAANMSSKNMVPAASESTASSL